MHSFASDFTTSQLWKAKVNSPNSTTRTDRKGKLRVTFAKNQTIEKNRWSNFVLEPLFILKLV